MDKKHGSFRPGGKSEVSAAIDLAPHLLYILAMALIRSLFWFVLFVFFTFSFVVLFEYGTHDFVPGFKTEFERVKAVVVSYANNPKPPEKKK